MSNETQFFLFRSEEINLIVKAPNAFMATSYANTFLEAKDFRHNQNSLKKVFHTNEAEPIDNDADFGVTVSFNQYNISFYDKETPFYKMSFKCFGDALKFPLEIDGDWVRIHCGVDGQPNYIFGEKGLKEFLAAGAGIYYRDKDNKPTQTFEQLLTWYNAEIKERIGVSKTIKQIKTIINENRSKFKL